MVGPTGPTGPVGPAGGGATLTLLADASNAVTGYALDAIPDNWKNGASTLTGLSIGGSVTSIGSYAFNYCSGFTGNLAIGSSVTTIGTYAFSNCYDFTGSLVIPNSVTTIGNYAFQSCYGFTGSLTIPSSVTSIGRSAFYACSGLTVVNANVAKSVLDVTNSLQGTGVTTIHARAADGTWTVSGGQTIGGKSGITVIKDL